MIEKEILFIFVIIILVVIKIQHKINSDMITVGYYMIHIERMHLFIKILRLI